MPNVVALLSAPAQFALWLGLAGGGLYLGWRHETTPGLAPTGAAISDWPAGTRLERAADRPTIVMFVHPACPCTTAALTGLAETLGKSSNGGAANGGAAKLVVAVVGARGLEREMTDGPNVRLARSIPGAGVVVDPDGAEARRFEAATSGQTYAYSPEGRLLFRGGLTSTRGHFGPSRGLDALGQVLKRGTTEWESAPVFGCALRNEASR